MLLPGPKPNFDAVLWDYSPAIEIASVIARAQNFYAEISFDGAQ